MEGRRWTAAYRPGKGRKESAQDEPEGIAVKRTYELSFGARRSQAFESGELLDVTWAARREEHPWPVAITRAAWGALCAFASRNRVDEQAVLRGALILLAEQVKKSGVSATVTFKAASSVPLVASYGPGDHGEPVVTIQAPWERR